MILDIPVAQLLIVSFSGLIAAFLQPFFYVAILLVYWQCRKLAAQQRAMFGFDNLPLRKAVMEFTCRGMLGGLLASMLMLLTGLSINDAGLQYIWPLAILLFFCNMRFMCFAYAGGLVALSNALFGWPLLAPSHVLALVAILHITESLLVFIGGRYADLPLYIFSRGKAAGCFCLSNFWPVPFIVMIAMGAPAQEVGEVLKMPDWWPLFPVLESTQGYEEVFMPTTVVGILGYGSIAATATPSVKRAVSSSLLFLYSVILFAAALFCVSEPRFGVIAALVSFLGHELIVKLDQKMEERGQLLYQNVPDGFAVLASIYGSPAYKAGIRPNDVIMKINSNRICDEHDFLLAASYLPLKFDIEVLRCGKAIVLPMQMEAENRKVLGIIRMPVEGRDGLVRPNANYSIFYSWYRNSKYFKNAKNKQ